MDAIGLYELLEKVGVPASMAFFVVVFCFLIFVVYKIGVRSNKIAGVDSIGDKLDGLKTDLSEMKGTQNIFTTSLEKIQDKFDDVKERITSIELAIRPSENKLAESHSPLRLTEKGKDFVSELGINDIMDEKWLEIKSNFPTLFGLTNPLDVQEQAQKLALEVFEFMTSQDQEDEIKKKLYEKGEGSNTLELLTRLILRDKVLDECGLELNDED